MYCGHENCYDVLGIKEKASLADVKKAYRKISLEVHPDKNKAPDAARQFQRIATAYEILSDPETRADYDYALAHPEEHLYNRYRYYSSYYRKTVQVDVRVVVVGCLLVFSALQYGCRVTAYNSAMRQVRRTPRYQHRLKQLRAEAEAKALSDSGTKRRTRGRGKSKPVPVDDEELEKLIDINLKGGYSKPEIKEILIVRLLLLPVSLVQSISWQCRWAYKYWLLKKPYDHEDQVFLTCRALHVSRDLWDLQPLEARERILQQRVWVPENYARFVRNAKAGASR
eukprot:CAMPEP_0177597222 /NCGR_PEP_ID=MMETSP0419_2-20121207/11584_1 /TAXON_ID=582737 /ORGANISM="Tetraselmis sp., Strain GSL018" /LENGTH=282 /DNA_ID=CAMNT_0019089353 /DNA_START=255 /DNA_END=1103 /DNA_ORIENTATION=+